MSDTTLLTIFNVITMSGVIIWVEATAMTGGKKQTIGLVLIAAGILIGLFFVQPIVIR